MCKICRNYQDNKHIAKKFHYHIKETQSLGYLSPFGCSSFFSFFSIEKFIPAYDQRLWRGGCSNGSVMLRYFPVILLKNISISISIPYHRDLVTI